PNRRSHALKAGPRCPRSTGSPSWMSSWGSHSTPPSSNGIGTMRRFTATSGVRCRTVGTTRCERLGSSSVVEERCDGSMFDPNEILKVLERHQVEFVLIGGMAASLYGSDVGCSGLDVVP